MSQVTVRSVVYQIDGQTYEGRLAFDAEHARRVADLELYLRQWHAERDQAALGRELMRAGTPTW